MGLPTATVRLRGPDDMERTATGMGTGPVDASYKAIDALVQVPVRCHLLTRALHAAPLQFLRYAAQAVPASAHCAASACSSCCLGRSTPAEQAPPSLYTLLVCSDEPRLLDMATMGLCVWGWHALNTTWKPTKRCTCFCMRLLVSQLP